MAGETADASRALAIALVHAVYPDAEFPARRPRSLALPGMPHEAVGVAKLTIDAAAEVDRRTARELDRRAQTVLMSSADHLNRVAAFNAQGVKRPR